MAQAPSAETVVIADGSTRQFSFEFFYLEPEDVFVTVDGVAVEFEWLASNTLLLAEAPEAGSTVRMYRSTPAARPKYEFQLGAPFLPRYIDENFTQGLYVLQEGLGDIGHTMDRMTDVESRMTDVEHQVENFQIESGFEYLGDYEAGIVLSRYNQVVAKDGEWYRIAANTGLPFTLTGDWVEDAPNLVGVGDATVRYDLGQPTGAGLVATSDGLSVQALFNALRDPLTGPAQLDWVARPPANEIIYVGDGGDYPTINAAIHAVSTRYRTVYTSRGDTAPPAVELRLMAGFVMAEQVLVRDVELQWITITAEDATVPIRRSALIESRASRYPAFSADGGSLPRIAALFDMDDTGDPTQRCGYQLINNATGMLYPGSGVLNVSGRAIHLVTSTLLGTDTIWDGAQDIGIRIANKSRAWMRRASFKNCRRGIALEDCSTLYFDSGDVSGATNNAITVGGGSVLWGNSVTAVEAGGVALNVENAGVAVCPGGDFSRCGNPGPAVRVLTGARAVLTGARIDDATGIGLLVRGAHASARGLIARSAGVNNVVSDSGGFVDCTDADLTGTSPGLLLTGGVAAASGVLGTSSQTPNTVLATGLVLTDAVVSNRGQATIPAGATSVKVFHGLTIPPLAGEVQVVPTTDPGDNAYYWVSDVGPDSFMINRRAVATVATGFAWMCTKVV